MLLANAVAGIMPWMLAFAAGAMIYVVVEELIPEAHLGEHSTGAPSALCSVFGDDDTGCGARLSRLFLHFWYRKADVSGRRIGHVRF